MRISDWSSDVCSSDLIDAATRFSWILLGRATRSAQELIYLYAALIALGSDLTAADMARMTLGITADGVGEMMRRIEAHGRLPEANRAVFDHFRTQIGRAQV